MAKINSTQVSIPTGVFANLPLQLPAYGPVVDGIRNDDEIEHFRLPFIDEIQRAKLDLAKKYAMDLSIKTVIQKQAAQINEQQSTNVKKAQALVLLSRIYIGSINYDVKEEHLRAAFSPFGSIRMLTLSYDPVSSKHKGFCFLEFEYPESAQMALVQMNGFPMGGRGIKVGRPSNMPSVTEMHEELLRECEKENRIFISNIHENITESDLQLVFEAFGKIVSCKLDYPPSNNIKHRGFGYIEFENKQSAADSIHSMNLFDLGGQQLRVGRVLTPKALLPECGGVNAAVSLPQVIKVNSPQQTVNHGNSPTTSESPKPLNATVASEVPITTSTKVASPIPVVYPSLNKTSDPNYIPPPTIVLPKLKSKPPTVSSQRKLAVSHNRDHEDEGIKIKSDLENMFSVSQSMDEVGDFLEDDRDCGMHIKGRDARTIMMQKLQRKVKQRVIVLRNMIGPEELDDYVEGEVIEECEKYGEVESVMIYEEKINPYEAEDVPNNIHVKIFVVFKYEEGASKAVLSLNNRFFGGRTVIAESYDKEIFEMGDFTR